MQRTGTAVTPGVPRGRPQDSQPEMWCRQPECVTFEMSGRPDRVCFGARFTTSPVASVDRAGRRAATAPLGAATASRLVRWRDGANQAAHHAEGAVSLARAVVFNAQHQLEILELALQQIDELLAPPRPVEPNLIEAAV